MTNEQRAVTGVALVLGLALMLSWWLIVQPETPADGADLGAAVDAEPAAWAARLQLAHAHFDAGEHDLALEHYQAILQQRPDNARALARAGWIAFESGDTATAVRLVSESLAVAPDDPEALWFLAHIRLDGLGDRAGARRVLERLADMDSLDPQARAQVAGLLARAEE